MSCTHRSTHQVDADVTYLEDSGRFVLDLRLQCVDCGEPFRFLGLPIGLDLKGACRSVDGTEARLAVHPKSDAVPDGSLGFTLRKVK